MKFKKKAELKSILTMQVEDAAADLYIPESVDDIVMFTNKEDDFHVLGGGSNVIAGEIEKPVIYMGVPFGNSETEDLDDDYVNIYMPGAALLTF